MRKLNFKKVLFGLSLSLVLAMAIGSFALGEMQTPTAPQATEPQVAATNSTGDFNVIGGTEGQNNDYHYDDAEMVLYIHPLSYDTNITISSQSQTTGRIKVTSAAKITLSGVDISTSNGPAFEITDDASFNVNIELADGTDNFLVSSGWDCAGLQKNGDSGVGTLTIGGTGTLTATGGYGGAGIGGGNNGSGSDIEIISGTVTATGESGAAGIGGGNIGSGSNIIITGGTVTAKGEAGAACIGGGYSGSASGNKLNGDNAVVLATGYGTLLEGFGDDGFIKGFAFTRSSEWVSYDGTMYGSIILSSDMEFPENITLNIGNGEASQTLTVDYGVTLTIPATSSITMYKNGTLNVNKDESAPTRDGKIECNGSLKTAVDFVAPSIIYVPEETFDYIENGVADQQYGTNLPSITLDGFEGWYKESSYTNKVESTTSVDLNCHTLYSKWSDVKPFKVTGGVENTDYKYDGIKLIILKSTPMTIENNDKAEATGWIIAIDENADGANLTLNGVNIATKSSHESRSWRTEGSPITIPENATFDVNILLADDKTNILDSSENQFYSGLSKSDDGSVEIEDLGTLTIGAAGPKGTGTLEVTGGPEAAGIGGINGFNGRKITITGGIVNANAYSSSGAGIGGGGSKNGSDIKITGGTVTATGGSGGAGIGGGYYGTGSDITISGGTVTANGGSRAAGIGGGSQGNGTGINITGGVVKAFGGYGESYDGTYKYPGAGIGGGSEEYGSGGEASDNHLSGNAVVFAVSGGEYADGTKKEALQGFDSASQGSIANCIIFTGVGIYEYNDDDYIWTLTGVNWDESGKMYGDVTLSQNVEMTSNLTIPEGQILSVDKDKEVKISGAKLIVEGELKNNGTLTLPNELEVKDNGKIETMLDYDPQGGTIKTNDGSYITYQDASGINQYESLPEATKEGYDLEGWHTEKTGKEDTKVEPTDNVLLNQHTLYANWVEPGPGPTPTPPGPEPTPTPPGPEPGPTPEPTPDPSVDPDGDGGGASSKTSDPFMGGIALALLGVATTGAVLVRKRK